MKTLIKSFLLLAFFCFTNHQLQAQDEATQRYYSMDYMKVEPGNHADYLALEKAWKKIHQANVAAGKYVGWALEKVEYPFGANAEYNYITRISIAGEEQLADYIENWEMPDLKSILSEEELALVKRTPEIRTFVKSEIWWRDDMVITENPNEINAVVWNFFDIPEGSSPSKHRKLEKEIWKPVHDARLKDGKIKGWVLLGKRLPYGMNEPYANATVDLYSNVLEYLNQDSPEPYFEKIHPGKSMEELGKKTWDAGKLIRSELRTPIDSTERPDDTSTKN